MYPIASTPSERPALIAGRYRLLEELGAGGMAVVHRAHDTVLDRQVAFKRLRTQRGAARYPTDAALFQREYHTLARLRHPRIIQVYDYGANEEGAYYTMELLDGRDLSELGSVPVLDACRYLRDVASSLALVHAHRLVHRDVSPRNVRVTAEGQAKLIDFGALTPFGVAPDVVGTPVCMAPEVLHRGRLDQRTDLYALGATGYRMLAGRHAYPARQTRQLPACWARAPQPPSAWVPDIPRELDLLILSLLSLDPVERPGDAATVIERLTALGGLEPDEHEFTAQSYVLSSRMVGREAELRWLDRRVERAVEGRGAEVFLQGPAGIGKTRLLQEFCLESQLKGVVALKADAQAFPAPLGVAIALGEGILAECPETAREAARPFAGLLAQLSGELHARLGSPPRAKLAANAAERRARFLSALRSWFLAVAHKETVLLAVDNVQSLDADSAALIAALGRDSQAAHLVVVVSHRTGDRVVAPAPVRMLRQRSGRLRLSGLDSGACVTLGKSLFGDVANAVRVARLLYDKSAGVPQQFMDLAQLLVARKIAKYVGGTWVLPVELRADELPSRSEEIFDAKLSGLPQVARDLVEALSIDGKPVSIERCLTLVEGAAERDIYAALDRLVADQILLFERGAYRLAQQTLREVVLAHMAEGVRRSRHLRAARSLLATGDTVTVRVEAALHFMEAGEEERAADMLARASWEFVASAQAYDVSDQLARALRAVVSVYERQRRSPHDLAAVLFPLVSVAFFSAEWRLVLQYGERALELGFDINGLDTAHRSSRFLGRSLGLALGLVRAKRGFDRAYPGGASFGPRDVIAWCCAVVPAAVGTATIVLDTERVLRLKKITEPFQLFPEGHVARVTYEYAAAHALTVQGRESESRELLARTLPLYDEPSVKKALGKGHAKAIHSGVVFAAGILECYRFGDSALRHAERIEELDSQVWVLAADQLRLLYHALRGESERVRYYRERVELFAVQGRSTWQVEVFLPVLVLTADVLTADTIAARRTWEQLARQARDVPSLEIYADAAHAAYLTLRGEWELAIGIYEEILPQLPPRTRVNWVTIRAHLADALNRSGQHARARDLLEETRRHVRPGDTPLVALYLEPERQLALALAGLREFDAAVRLLDRLLDMHRGEDNPLLVGLLHKARAEVALAMGDAACFRVQLGEMEQRFRSTENPALLAQWERLVDQAVRGAALPSSHRFFPVEFADPVPQEWTDRGAAPEPDPYLRVLRAIQHRARAGAGHLYLFGRDGLRRVASTTSAPPPEAAESDLLRLAERAALEAREPDRLSRPDGAADATDEGGTTETTLTHSILIESARLGVAKSSEHQLVLLATSLQEHADIVGGVILQMKEHHLFRLSPQFLENVAKSLEERMITTQ